jgi:hypothetical protein
MQLVREQDGTWSLKIETESDKTTIERSHASYPEALPRYVTAFDPAFTKAAQTSEFVLLSAVLRVRGIQDAGCLGSTNYAAAHSGNFLGFLSSRRYLG